MKKYAFLIFILVSLLSCEKDITFNSLGPVGDKVEEWVLKGAWCSDVNFNEMDWANDGEAVTITVTIAYDYAILNF